MSPGTSFQVHLLKPGSLGLTIGVENFTDGISRVVVQNSIGKASECFGKVQVGDILISGNSGDRMECKTSDNYITGITTFLICTAKKEIQSWPRPVVLKFFRPENIIVEIDEEVEEIPYISQDPLPWEKEPNEDY